MTRKLPPALGTGLDIDGKNAGCVSSTFGRKLLFVALQIKFVEGLLWGEAEVYSREWAIDASDPI